MTIRRGGRPRDPGHARPIGRDAAEPWASAGDRHGDPHGANDDPPVYERAPAFDPGPSREYGSVYDRGVNRRRNGRRRNGGSGGVRLAKFLVFTLALAVMVLAVSLTVMRPVVRAAIVDWAWDNPGSMRIGFVNEMVREDLGASLTDPASADPEEIEFTVQSGDTPTTLAPRLVAAGVSTSERAFLFQAMEDGLAPRLTAGRFLLRQNMTPAELTAGLVANRIVVETFPVTFREGLRLEQMTALLQTLDTGVDPAEFYELTKRPPARLLADYPWLQVPEGGSLEGYLYPATYSLVTRSTSPNQPVTDAEDLVRQLLDQFIRVVGRERMDVPEERGMTFYEILSLASIVEREAVLESERPTIAGVYQNRLDGLNGHLRLEADPTVFYAADTMALAELPFERWREYLFWAPPGGRLADLSVPDELAGFHTYQNGGLIPAPIASPRLSSIDAALEPDQEAGYRFFVAIPDGGGAHDFSVTFAEHEAKLRQYGYIQ